MNRDRANQLWAIMRAYAEGKSIQYRVVGYDDWNDVDDEEGINEDTRFEYRIKPEKETFVCWKCGRKLPISERALPMYPFLPPKYACKECEGLKKQRYTEIFRLKKMLENAHIPFEWLEHGGDKQGYQICYPEKGEKRVCSVIEHQYSYGSERDLLEIMGLLTPEEEKDWGGDTVLGYLTADDVFSRISAHWEKANTPSYRPFLETAELILEWDKKLGDISVLGRPVEPCSLQEPFIWVKHKVDDRRRLITGFGENFVELGNKSKPVTMQRLFEMYTFLDGTPCGKQKEE